MIIRSIRTQNFTIIPNLVIEDKKLDWKELGLLVFLLSKPDEWEVSVHHLAKQRKAGRDAILNMLKALRDAGYIVMQRKAEGGVDYVIYDTPQPKEKPKPENPEVAAENPDPKPEKPLTDYPLTEKPLTDNPVALVNTDKAVSTEEEVKTELEQGAPPENPPAEITETEKASERVAAHLFQRLVKEIPEAKILNPQNWITDIDRAIRIDSRSEAELMEIIDWMHTGDRFWVRNIQSGKKLRDKYITMIAQKRAPKSGNNRTTKDFSQTDYRAGTEGFETNA